MPPPPSYFEAMKAETGRILHDLSNQSAIVQNNARFLFDSTLRGLSSDQLAALRDAKDSSEKAAALIRELRAILG